MNPASHAHRLAPCIFFGFSSFGCAGATTEPTPLGSQIDHARFGSICAEPLPTQTPNLTNKTIPEALPGVPSEATFSFLEGPVWLNGSLYLSYVVQVEQSDLDSGHILKYVPGAGFSVFAPNVGTNGLAIDEQGRLFAASHGVGGIVSFDVTQGASSQKTLTDGYGGSRFNSPNDLVVLSDGTIYFTDPNYQCGGCSSQPTLGVYRLPRGGSPILLPNVRHDPPNGIAVSPDEKTLYVGGAPLVAYPILDDGSVGEGTPFGDIPATDGLGMDCAGNLYVTRFSENEIVVLDPNGERLPGALRVPHPTNVAFGGADGRTLYITNQVDDGALRAIPWDLPGYPY